MRIQIIPAALALFSLTLSASALAREVVGVAPVSYRLVGDDEPSLQKARMVEEQVAAGIGEAGRVPRRKDVPPQAPVVKVAVEESGALYEFIVEIEGGKLEQGRFTGPFAGMLQEVRGTVRRLVEGHGKAADKEAATEEAKPPPIAKESAVEPEPEPEQEPEPEPEPGDEAATERNPWWVGSLALTAAGGAALIAGIVLFFVDDPCVDETSFGCREYLDTTVPAIPLAGLGGIAAGVGIAGLLSLESTRPAASAPTAAGGKAGIMPRVSRAGRGAVFGLSLCF